MSKTTGFGFMAGYMLIALAIGLGVLLVLACLVGWLLPLATAGAMAPGFMQAVAIVTLALLARIFVFSKK